MRSALLACAVSAAVAATPMQSLSDRWSAALASWSNAQLLEAHERSSETPRVAGTPSRSVLATELAARAGDLAFSDDDWRLALRLADSIHCRPRWPAGEPLVLWLRGLPWLAAERLRVRTCEPELGAAVMDHATGSCYAPCGFSASAQVDAERERRLLPLPRGVRAILCEVTIELGEPCPDVPVPIALTGCRPAPRCLWSGTYEIAVEAVEDPFAAMEPMSTVEFDSSLRESLRLGLVDVYRREEPAVGLRRVVTSPTCDEMRGVAFRARAELRHFGRIVCRTEGGRAFAPILSFPLELLDPTADLTGWSIMLRGSPSDALIAWEAEQWWCGELEIPLAELVARGVRD